MSFVLPYDDWCEFSKSNLYKHLQEYLQELKRRDNLQVILDSGIYDETTFTFEVLALEHVRNGKVYYVPTYNEHLPINLPMLSSHAG